MVDAYIVEADWDRSGVWTGTGEVITSRVLSRSGVQTSRGSSLGRGILLPEAGRFNAELNNVSQDYSLENATSPLVGLLKPNTPVRIRWGPGVPYNVWRGFNTGLPQNPDKAHRSVNLPCTGIFSRLRRTGFASSLYIDTPINTCMQAVLSALGMDSATYRDFDLATTSLKYWWFGPGDDLFDVMVKLWLSEGDGALLYEDGQGRIAFRNRMQQYTLARMTTSQVTFRDTGAEPTYMAPIQYGDPWQGIVNAVQITNVVRTAETGIRPVIWTYGDPLSLAAGETVTLIVSAATGRGDDGTFAGTVPFLSAVDPVSGTDYTLSGTALASATLNRPSGVQATLTIVAGAGAATLTGLQVRAYSVPVTSSRVIKNSVSAAASITDYGEQPYTVECYGEMDINDQQSIADALVTRNKDPRSIVTFPIVSGHATRVTQQFTREIGDRFTFVEPQTGVNDEFTLARIEHDITHAGLFTRTHFGARKCPATVSPFILDSSSLGGTDVLVY